MINGLITRVFSSSLLIRWGKGFSMDNVCCMWVGGVGGGRGFRIYVIIKLELLSIFWILFLRKVSCWICIGFNGEL